MVESAPAAEIDTTEIDRFLDALWMERGLSRNTLAAYRRDLAGFAYWLDEQRQCSLLVARREDLLAYLVRRLLENGANSSFVNQIVDETVPAETVAADPFLPVDRRTTRVHPDCDPDRCGE